MWGSNLLLTHQRDCRQCMHQKMPACTTLKGCRLQAQACYLASYRCCLCRLLPGLRSRLLCRCPLLLRPLLLLRCLLLSLLLLLCVLSSPPLCLVLDRSLLLLLSCLRPSLERSRLLAWRSPLLLRLRWRRCCLLLLWRRLSSWREAGRRPRAESSLDLPLLLLLLPLLLLSLLRPRLCDARLCPTEERSRPLPGRPAAALAAAAAAAAAAAICCDTSADSCIPGAGTSAPAAEGACADALLPAAYNAGRVGGLAACWLLATARAPACAARTASSFSPGNTVTAGPSCLCRRAFQLLWLAAAASAAASASALPVAGSGCTSPSSRCSAAPLACPAAIASAAVAGPATS